MGTWFTGGSATTTKPQLLIEPTGTTSTGWSTSGTGIGVNAPDAFAGRLFDGQINGASKTTLDVDATGHGRLTLTNTSAAVRWSILGRTTGWDFYNNSTWVAQLAGASAALATLYIDNLGDFSTGDTFLVMRDGANGKMAQRNSTNAQTFRIYNTYTSSTNLERGKLEWSSNIFNIGTEKGSGGGTARALALQTDGTTRMSIEATTQNIAMLATAGSYGSGSGVLFLGNTTTAPSSNPTGGGIIYIDAGTPKFRHPSSVINNQTGEWVPQPQSRATTATPRAQYDAMKKGDVYIGTDGKQYIKG